MDQQYLKRVFRTDTVGNESLAYLPPHIKLHLTQSTKFAEGQVVMKEESRVLLEIPLPPYRVKAPFFFAADH